MLKKILTDPFSLFTLGTVSIVWFLSLFYFLSDGAESFSDFFFSFGGFILLTVISVVFLFLYLKKKGWHFQSVFALIRHPGVYVVLLSFLGSYLLNIYPYIPFEIRFKLSQQALEDFAKHPISDNDNSTVQWVGLFPLREVDIAGTSVRMIVSECFLDDCGFVYSPNGDPPIVYEDSYYELPFAENWYYWHRSW
ncbi:MAG: hypothetical protein INR81_21260 [Microcystis aeruginosa PMC 728.11]|jgi:hypothetical protein|uniref:hypothetical protein n=1 Tax=Microcystis sp. M_OC_Ca_00000000_S217Cul TaxID=2486214 RepID=UPI001192A36E|nr:hypothetical protein [Microcystis sp. M_OC_Ca_00000000_S217Cul]MBE5231480.1 hypothetical protein [Microcystis aeruginosa PMC 728.11]MCZ8188348.1 hypothetical protein [Microcystis sp. LE19-338.1B]MCZ8360954.1 hypothetical protein [Microcystis sp. LE19-388.1G]TRT92430.1 MAG: hypothetical protein EWV66_04425 [Microcystis sp. M_OC_Ca_00000000_C217Col]